MERPARDARLLVNGEGDWTEELGALLGRRLDRITYFGRAEILMRIFVAGADDVILAANCTLTAKRTARAVPVLSSPLENATGDDVERTTDNPDAVNGLFLLAHHGSTRFDRRAQLR